MRSAVADGDRAMLNAFLVETASHCSVESADLGWGSDRQAPEHLWRGFITAVLPSLARSTFINLKRF